MRAQAQDFERYRPKVPYNTEGESKLPEEPKEATGDTKVLVDELRALVFVDHPDQVIAGPLQVADGIHVQGESLGMLRNEAFHAIVRPYLHEPITIRRLNEMTRDVILFYRRSDRPVVDVSVPVQDVTDGIVQVVVTEARVGKVRVEDACFFDPCHMALQPCVSSGDIIFESMLLEDLQWLNQNPFREVDMELTPGDAFGETDVVFKVRDRRPLRVYTGYEDTGTRQTDLERLLFGLNYGNMFDRGHQVAYQYTVSPDFDDLAAHSVLYSIPLLNRDTLAFWGSYADTSAAATPFDLTGRAWQTSLRYNRNFCAHECWEHYGVAGFDFKQTNTNLDFGGTQVFDSSADIVQFMAGYHAIRRNGRSALAVGGEMFASPGELSSGNDDESFQVIRAGATADYFYTRMYAERQLPLNGWLNFVARITGQISEANLLPSETLGFGGYTSVRGYDMRVVNADSGYVLNLELRSEPVTLGLAKRHCDEFQWLLFYDAGEASNHSLLPGEDPSIDLNSAGAGFRYSAGPNLSMRFDYGWQLNDITAMPDHDSRAHVGIVFAR
ncbi:MAG: ShlB/FhaC/HecB family hemolysin secretion/activation protein [Pirellulales bacterium]